MISDRLKNAVETTAWIIAILVLGFVPYLVVVDAVVSAGKWHGGKQWVHVWSAAIVYSVATLLVANLFALPAARFRTWRARRDGLALASDRQQEYRRYWLNLCSAAAFVLLVALLTMGAFL